MYVRVYVNVCMYACMHVFMYELLSHEHVDTIQRLAAFIFHLSNEMMQMNLIFEKLLCLVS